MKQDIAVVHVSKAGPLKGVATIGTANKMRPGRMHDRTPRFYFGHHSRGLVFAKDFLTAACPPPSILNVS
jgi:hypothetical protein